VYALYAEHVDLVSTYASMLWSELDVAKMMAGTEKVRGSLHAHETLLGELGVAKKMAGS